MGPNRRSCMGVKRVIHGAKHKAKHGAKHGAKPGAKQRTKHGAIHGTKQVCYYIIAWSH